MQLLIGSIRPTYAEKSQSHGKMPDFAAVADAGPLPRSTLYTLGDQHTPSCPKGPGKNRPPAPLEFTELPMPWDG